ncbi:MAG: hypothetical protein PVF27_03180 [Gemmatimonadales bacterium]|jgi:hypothetical protein
MRVVQRAVLVAAFVLSASPAATSHAAAQDTPADTAMVLVQVAQSLETAGERELAEELYRLVLERYPDTAAADLAAGRLDALGNVRRQGNGRVRFVVYNTLFGTWLGLAIPLAAGAEEAPAFGAGLLAGGGLGFLASNAYSGSRPMTTGQAGAYTFATGWATWQAIGWREVFDIGGGEECYTDEWGTYCYDTTPDEAPVTAAVVGGLAGVAGGLWLSTLPIQAGDMTLVDHSASWGTYYGAVLYILTHEDGDGDDDALWTHLLLGGDILAAAAIPAARAWQPTEGQVRLTSIAGVAGGIAGLGVDLLLEVDDDDTAILIPTIGATAGLIAGAAMTRLTAREPRPAPTETAAVDMALVNVHQGVRLALPTPLPMPVPSLTPEGRIRYRPGMRISLFDARF